VYVRTSGGRGVELGMIWEGKIGHIHVMGHAWVVGGGAYRQGGTYMWRGGAYISITKYKKEMDTNQDNKVFSFYKLLHVSDVISFFSNMTYLHISFRI
jgi:hypothetical protein